jgi:anaerobic magnesium-protoporphyrin IX monomethyl ester cyclase
MLDVAILVPFQGQEGLWLEPMARRSQGPARLLAILGRQRLADALGVDVRSIVPAWARPHRYRVPRTSGAVALASSAERAGLRWHAVDPGEIALGEWRRRLVALRARSPRLVAINTTFINEVRWLHLFCAMVRSALPDARVALGGYYYATDARGFLGASADIFCVGEGEERLGRIARAVRDGQSLDDIPGLFLREKDGRLRSTGSPAALDIETMPLPDWSLSTRMDPPLDPEREPMLFHVETQRGCYFKCEFCTFRTLSERAMMSPARGADAVLGAARAGLGRTFLADATATFPKARWQAVLESIASAGGSPQPLTAFARVTDLDDAACASMHRAGVRHLFIGQESGDQKILNAMRKGTRVADVRPALDSLARHGVKATFGFICGFPGEDAAAAALSREMMLHLNDGHDDPTVLVVYLDVFAAQDLATVSVRSELGARKHPFDYGDMPMPANEAAMQALRNCIALAESDTAPVTGFGLTSLVGDLITAFSHDADWRTAFRWLKAYDRGVSLFVRHELDGTPIDAKVLDEVRRTLAHEVASRRASGLATLRERARTFTARALLREWRREAVAGPGLVTRCLTASSIWEASHDPRASLAALRTATSPAVLATLPSEVRASRDADAASLVELGLRQGKPPPKARVVLPTGT